MSVGSEVELRTRDLVNGLRIFTQVKKKCRSRLDGDRHVGVLVGYSVGGELSWITMLESRFIIHRSKNDLKRVSFEDI